MELFRHNHARFISLSSLNLQFSEIDAEGFNNYIKIMWKNSNSNNKNFKFVSYLIYK